MTAPTADYLRTLAVAPNRLGDGWRISAVAALHQSADALAAVTAERDQANENLRASEKMREDLRVVLNQVCDERDVAVAIVDDCERDMKALRGRIHDLTVDRDTFISLAQRADSQAEELHKIGNQLREQRDQALKATADAPHGDDCRTLFEERTRPYADHRCDCWKAEL